MSAENRQRQLPPLAGDGRVSLEQLAGADGVAGDEPAAGLVLGLTIGIRGSPFLHGQHGDVTGHARLRGPMRPAQPMARATSAPVLAWITASRSIPRCSILVMALGMSTEMGALMLLVWTSVEIVSGQKPCSARW